jgi:NAD-dependent SIR2 family protein deacetylase
MAETFNSYDYEPRRSSRKRKAIKYQDSDNEGDSDNLEEIIEDEMIIQEKITKLTELIAKSKNIVVFSGAGISTTAGISDYRGKKGLWTMEKKRQKMFKNGTKVPTTIIKKEKQDKIWFPTATHMILRELVERDIVKFIITQNCDNLHETSGIPSSKLLALHGNSFTEICPQCKQIFHRNFVITKPTAPHIYSNAKKLKSVFTDEEERLNVHRTSRKCDTCQCYLVDTIINFGEPVPEHVWNIATENAKRADLMIVLGSSLKVRPAMDLPGLAEKIAICNLQKTPLNSAAVLVIHATCDVVMTRLAEALKVPIPYFQYHTHVKLRICSDGPKLRFTADGPQLKSFKMEREKTVVNMNAKNQLSTKVSPFRKPVDVEYLTSITIDIWRFAKTLQSDTAQLLLIIPADVMMQKIEHEMVIKLIYDTGSGKWNAQETY